MARRRVVEEALGMALPEAWYRFGREYGRGSFETRSGLTVSLSILSPFAKDFLKTVDEWCEGYRGLKAMRTRRAFPYEVFPTRPGLLFCGSGERRALFWLTKGAPDDWPLVMLDPDDRFHSVRTGLPGFLLDLFEGRSDCFGGDWDADWFRANRGTFIFRPARPRPSAMRGDSTA